MADAKIKFSSGGEAGLESLVTCLREQGLEVAVEVTCDEYHGTWAVFEAIITIPGSALAAVQLAAKIRTAVRKYHEAKASHLARDDVIELDEHDQPIGYL